MLLIDPEDQVAPSPPAQEVGPPRLPLEVAPAVERVQEGILLLTPEAEQAIRPPVEIFTPPRIPTPEPDTPPGAVPAAEAGPADDGDAAMGAYTEAGFYCASCTPCAGREGEPLGLSPVPVDYLPQQDLPTLPGGAPAAEGPASAADVAAGLGELGAEDCMTMLEVLEGIPEASGWLELMRVSGACLPCCGRRRSGERRKPSAAQIL